MSYEAANATDLLGPFASNLGYGELIAAVDAKSPTLQSLFKNGATEDVSKAVEELRKLEGSENAVTTAKALVDLIDGQELIIITDGVSDEEDVAKAGNGIMIAWFPTAELADKLAQEGGEKPEELHVTLAYLGKQEAFTDDQVELLKDAVEEYCSKYAPLQGTLGGNGRFPATPSSDDKDVLIKMVDVALLEKFREGLIEELADKGISIVRNHGCTPHMTLAYVDPDYTGECTHPDTEDIVIDALTVAIGGERHVYPLNGEEVLKMELTASQVHSDKPLTDEEKKRKVKKSDLEAEFGDDMEEKTFNAEIIKVNADKKQVFGWASLISKNGVPIEDTQGDLISSDDLEKMAYGFVSECRVGGEMHKRKGVGKLIESLVLTVEKAKAMGIELPGGVEGWWTGWQVTDDDVWDKVKKGVYKSFSVHGVGIRTKIIVEE